MTCSCRLPLTFHTVLREAQGHVCRTKYPIHSSLVPHIAPVRALNAYFISHNSSACGLNVKLPFSQRCMYDLTCHHFSLFHLSVLHPSGFCLRNEGVVITGNVDSRGDGITKCELRLCWAVERPRPLIKLPPTECFKNLADGSQLTDAAVTLGRNEVCKTNLKHLDLHRDYCTPPSLFISLR